MTVGETTEDTVGFSDATLTSGGSMDPESVTTAGSTYRVNQLDVGTYEDALIFKTNPPLSSRASYTLEFAGETLPLSDAGFSPADGSVFPWTWLAAKAPSLSETQFRTTLAVDKEVPVCLRTASQVCPGGTTIIPTSSDADPERPGAGGQRRQHDFAEPGLREGDGHLHGVGGQRDRPR